MNLKKVIVLFLLALSFSSVQSMEPDVFVQSTVNRASQILSENLTKEEKISKLKSIAKETVDIKGIGFYSLGSTRKNLDTNQKKKYSFLCLLPNSILLKDMACCGKKVKLNITCPS